jgi:DNA polymerase-3 subunit delta'
MKPFSRICGQEAARALLTAAVESGRLAHAYMLAGPEGSGRLSMALDLAACMVCPEEEAGFCGVCRHCGRIFALNHPDVRLTIPRTAQVTPEDEASLMEARVADGVTPLRFPGNTGIGIGQIREIEARLSRKSFEGRGHVEIILDAHLMRRESANALLKTLEEPPDSTLLILTTSYLSGILPTVRSRAHCVRLGSLDPGQVESVILERTSLDAGTARELSMASGGSPGRALAVAARWEGGGESRALALLRSLAEIGDQGGLLEMAGGLSRELGRDGLLALCDDVVCAAQDMRRVLAGRAPVSHGVESARCFSDAFLDRVQESFRTCGSRLRANVSPAMALEAAVLPLGGNGKK